MTSSVRGKLSVPWIGFHFFLSFEFVLPEKRPRRLSGRRSGGLTRLAQKPLAVPSFIVQNSPAVVLIDSPHHRIRSGTNWPVKSRWGKRGAAAGRRAVVGLSRVLRELHLPPLRPCTPRAIAAADAAKERRTVNHRHARRGRQRVHPRRLLSWNARSPTTPLKPRRGRPGNRPCRPRVGRALERGAPPT